jgi:hypothetical protein
MSYQTCPDWPELMEIAADLQFKHLTVQQAQLPADALMQIPGEPDRPGSLRRPNHVSSRATDPRVVVAPAAHRDDLTE